MNIDEPLRIISSALVEPGGQELSIGSDRWHVLFGDRQRPLLMPVGSYRFQKRCLPFFIGNRLKALYAQALLKANSLLPDAGLLPEFRLPQSRRGLRNCRFPSCKPSHAAIQIGTSGPYQKASMLLMSERGDGLALAKVAMVPSADQMVAAEAGWLRRLQETRKLEGHVPRLLGEGKALNGRRYLVTTLAPSTRTTKAFTSAHARFLSILGHTRKDMMRFSASPCWEYLEETLDEITPDLACRDLKALKSALHDCQSALSGWSGPFVVAQGDFAPWNIRLHQQRIFVFDWEYAKAGANPLFDVFNYLLIQQAVSGSGMGIRVLTTAMRRAQKIAPLLHAGMKWGPQEISALALAYLLEVLLCYSRSKRRIDRAHPVMQSYWRLVARRDEWLVAA
jgi:thiamine kinase-like enzyme